MPTYVIIVACLSSDIINGTCVPWNAFSSDAAAKGLPWLLFSFTYLLPVVTMVFCYARVIHTLRTKVTFNYVSVAKVRLNG